MDGGQDVLMQATSIATRRWNLSSTLLVLHYFHSDFFPLTFLLHCTTDDNKTTLTGIESVIISGPVYLQAQLKSKECRALSLQPCDHYFPFSSKSNCQQNEKQQQTRRTLWMTGGWKLQCHLVITDT